MQSQKYAISSFTLSLFRNNGFKTPFRLGVTM